MSTLAQLLQELKEFRQAVSDSQTNARSAAAALALLFFDILLTTDDEVKYIWRKPWSVSKTAYVTGRYIGLVNLFVFTAAAAQSSPSVSFCNVWKYYISIWTVLTSLAPCNIILGLRLDRLYSNILPIRILLLVLFIALLAEVTTHIVILTLYDTHLSPPGIEGLSQFSAILIGCLEQLDGDKFLFIITAIPNLLLTCIYLVLALHKFLNHLREREDMQGLSIIRDNNRLALMLSLLFTDGVIVYAMIFGVVILNGVVLWSAPNRIIQEIGVPWLISICSLASSRLLLLLGGNTSNIPGVYKRGTEYHIQRRTQAEYELDSTTVAEHQTRTYDSKVGTWNYRIAPETSRYESAK